MLDKVTCMVVDDDKIDRLTVLVLLRRYPYMECIGDYAAAGPALAAAADKMPDVLFLDVDMPEMNGLALREQLLQVPACIFVTAFPDYALEAFDLAALDFLVKPVSPERFARTMGRVEEYSRLRQRSAQLSYTLADEAVVIKEGYERHKLRMDEILYLEALNNYTGLMTTQRRYTVLTPISALLKEAPFRQFVRIHRSFAVNKNYVTRIGTADLEVQGRKLPVGRTYKEILDELAR